MLEGLSKGLDSDENTLDSPRGGHRCRTRHDLLASFRWQQEGPFQRQRRPRVAAERESLPDREGCPARRDSRDARAARLPARAQSRRRPRSEDSLLAAVSFGGRGVFGRRHGRDPWERDPLG